MGNRVKPDPVGKQIGGVFLASVIIIGMILVPYLIVEAQPELKQTFAWVFGGICFFIIIAILTGGKKGNK